MARRSEHSTAELKELAITHAYELVKEKGEAGFKARTIAKRMGYTVGTIYYVFGSMEQLRLHVCAKILDHFAGIVQKELPKKKNKLNYQISRYIKFATEYHNHWSFLYSPRYGKEPDWYLEKTKNFFSLFAEPFYALIKEKKAAQKAAKVIWASLHGISILSITGKLSLMGESSPEAMAKHLVKTYLAGLSQ